MQTLSSLATLRRRIDDEYRRRTPRSRALHEEATRYLPGGDTRWGMAFPPYPTYVESAAGSVLRDVDGNALLDVGFNATSLIHGHAHPRVVAAIEAQVRRGTAYAAPNPLQPRLARLLCERIPSLARVRFCNSGTEANMLALKAARAYTGRDRALKMDGAYHGSYEGLEMNAASGGDGPEATPWTRGIPRNEAENVLVAPFGDAAAAERLIERHGKELAAVVVNPVMTRGALQVPTEGYLARLRAATRAVGTLLVFDEVITLRVGPGGAQGRYGVAPDLTAMGKIVGGGLPVGAFGGRADVMEQFAADRGAPAVAHAGTFNGNPTTLAAGLATLELLTPAAFEHLERSGARLEARLRAAVDRSGWPLEVRRVASLLSLALADGVGSEAAAEVTEAVGLAHLALLTRGFKTSAIMATATITTDAEIDALGDALTAVLGEVGAACTFRR